VRKSKGKSLKRETHREEERENDDCPRVNFLLDQGTELGKVDSRLSIFGRKKQREREKGKGAVVVNIVFMHVPGHVGKGDTNVWGGNGRKNGTRRMTTKGPNDRRRGAAQQWWSTRPGLENRGRDQEK